MSGPVLYTAPFTSGNAVLIALLEAGIPHETRYVNLRAGEHKRPEFLAINPKGQVPALQLPDGRVLTEHPALMAWAAAAAPDSGLMPADPAGMAEALQWASWGGWVLGTAIGPAYAPARYAEPSSPETEAAIRARALAKLAAALDLAEAALEGRDWVLGGARRSIADISVQMVAGAGRMFGLPFDRLPRLSAHGERFGALPGVQAARESDKAAAGQ
ncbi:MAG: glutathione S-transferase family protein [Acetobacteraceae bacterium]|nr:glutathione S-transferase family protein [Acetobacteraceae bacterium]